MRARRFACREIKCSYVSNAANFEEPKTGYYKLNRFRQLLFDQYHPQSFFLALQVFYNTNFVVESEISALGLKPIRYYAS